MSPPSGRRGGLLALAVAVAVTAAVTAWLVAHLMGGGGSVAPG